MKKFGFYGFKNVNVVLPREFCEILVKIKKKFELSNNAQAICKALELAKEVMEA